MWKSSEQPPCWPPWLPPCRPPCPTPCQPRMQLVTIFWGFLIFCSAVTMVSVFERKKWKVVWMRPQTEYISKFTRAGSVVDECQEDQQCMAVPKCLYSRKIMACLVARGGNRPSSLLWPFGNKGCLSPAPVPTICGHRVAAIWRQLMRKIGRWLRLKETGDLASREVAALWV